MICRSRRVRLVWAFVMCELYNLSVSLITHRAEHVNPGRVDEAVQPKRASSGDEIVAVDSRRVDAAYYERPDWSRGPAGTRVVLERADGSRIAVTLADYY